MKIPLEDNFADVLNKAASGLGYNAMGLSRLTGLDPIRIQMVLDGKFESGTVMNLANVLDLHAPSIFQLATKAWYPEQVSINGLAAFNTPFPVPGYEEMTVNSYLVWEPNSRVAAAFDTGANIVEMMRIIEKESLKLTSVFLTQNTTTTSKRFRNCCRLLDARRFSPTSWKRFRGQDYSKRELFSQ